MPPWPDDAVLPTFADGDDRGWIQLNLELAPAPSFRVSSWPVVDALDRWCDAHHLASPAKIVAQRDRDARKDASADQRKLLGVTAGEPLRYRRVKLACGSHVLSEADNWYVPARLTADMNHQLDTTDIAFGRAVQPLHFQRRTLSATLLWSPLPEGWETGSAPLPDAAGKVLQIPHAVLQHQAVLTLPDGTPLSEVIETYTDEVLAFPQPRPR